MRRPRGSRRRIAPVTRSCATDMAPSASSTSPSRSARRSTARTASTRRTPTSSSAFDLVVAGRRSLQEVVGTASLRPVPAPAPAAGRSAAVRRVSSWCRACSAPSARVMDAAARWSSVSACTAAWVSSTGSASSLPTISTRSRRTCSRPEVSWSAAWRSAPGRAPPRPRRCRARRGSRSGPSVQPRRRVLQRSADRTALVVVQLPRQLGHNAGEVARAGR